MKRFIPFILIILSQWGCGSEPEVASKSSLKALLSFSFRQGINPSLAADVTAQITGKNITVALPAGARPETLKATFTCSPSSTVTVNGILQESGVSINDFTQPVPYRVTAEDGSSADYIVTVTVSATKSSDKELLSFAFLKTANASLSQDIQVAITPSKNTYLVTLPVGADISALKPAFAISPAAIVTVNNFVQISGTTSQDFSRSVIYRVTAQDGTFREFTFEATVQHDIPTIENAVKAFMTKHDVPGMSVAITKDERLVYAKGYGFSNKEKGEPVTTASMFRLASVSKPVTAIAVLKLVDSGKLRLDQKVFGPGGILGTTYGKQPYSPQLLQITLRQVLDHTAGGDAWNHAWNYPTRIDPFYQPEWLNYTQAQVISAVLDTRPVTETPGTRMVYSNIGPNIAGRIIEKVSGMSYEKYVQEHILNPIGISSESMRIGRSTLAERFPNEVVYYNPYPGYDQPYDFPMSRMDAHSGWISTGVNMARLLVHADGMTGKPDIISLNAWKEMRTPSAVSIPPGGYAGYGLCWFASVNDAYWHSGGMAGTATYWMKIFGYTFTILINTRSGSPDYYSDIDRLCYQMTAELTLNTYMKGDQFEVYFK